MALAAGASAAAALRAAAGRPRAARAAAAAAQPAARPALCGAPLRLGRQRCVLRRVSARGAHRAAAATRAALGGEAAEALERGKQTYANGERMAALKMFEAALKTADPPMEVRRELLYSAGCCHAAFGDIESAWQCLRDAIEMGLDYNDAETDPNLMRMEASAQMRIQLRKYAEGRIKSSGTYAKEAFNRSRAVTGVTVGERPRSKAQQYALQDLEISDDTDESFAAITKRVLSLLAVVLLGGAALFYLGLSSLR